MIADVTDRLMVTAVAALDRGSTSNGGDSRVAGLIEEMTMKSLGLVMRIGGC